MESNNRIVWIILGAVLIFACCCSMLVVMAAAGIFVNREVSLGSFGPGSRFEQGDEWTFPVGEAPRIDVTNFAGTVTVQAGLGNTVQVVAVKKAPRSRDLERIKVQALPRDSGVVIKTERGTVIGSNASVNLTITAPAGSVLEIDTGAGTIETRGIAGPMELHSGAGTVNITGAAGPVQVVIGAGTINYEGTPSGHSTFGTGTGTIVLALPASTNVEVDLDTGVGTVNVEFPVDGRISKREVQGVIGDGSQGSISAHTGAGSIAVTRR